MTKQRPLRHRLLAVMLLAACAREPLETWMLGTFSSREPPTGDFTGSFEIYEFHAGGMLEVRSYVYGNLVVVLERHWRSKERDVLAIRPDSDEYPGTDWTFERRGVCGPFVHNTFNSGNLVPGEGEFFRGEACVHEDPEPCMGCDGAYLEWCEGEPPPCDDGSEASSEGSDG